MVAELCHLKSGVCWSTPLEGTRHLFHFFNFDHVRFVQIFFHRANDIGVFTEGSSLFAVDDDAVHGVFGSLRRVIIGAGVRFEAKDGCEALGVACGDLLAPGGIGEFFGILRVVDKAVFG